MVNKTLNLSETVYTLVPVHTAIYARISPFSEAILDTAITLYKAYNCECTVMFLFVSSFSLRCLARDHTVPSPSVIFREVLCFSGKRFKAFPPKLEVER